MNLNSYKNYRDEPDSSLTNFFKPVLQIGVGTLTFGGIINNVEIDNNFIANMQQVSSVKSFVNDYKKPGSNVNFGEADRQGNNGLLIKESDSGELEVVFYMNGEEFIRRSELARYEQTIEEKFNNIEHRFDNIDSTLLTIQEALKENPSKKDLDILKLSMENKMHSWGWKLFLGIPALITIFNWLISLLP